jgi:PadR family transcriptional regulator PadR
MANIRNALQNDSNSKRETQLRKGCLELAVLASLWDGRLYGLEILERLEAGPQLIVSEGTIYPLLGRLKAEGLLDSAWIESGGGHPRKYYRLTAVGREQTLAMARLWSAFSTKVASLLGPLLNKGA